MTARTMQPLDPNVVAPWRIGDAARGVLLIHGFAGTPPELRGCGELLAANGWQCRGILLPGHGTEPQDLERTTWEDWAAAVQAEMDDLARDCDLVCVVGQSMGAALALHLAATDLRIAAAACLATPLWLNGILPRFLPLIQHVVRWHEPGDDVDLWDPSAVDQLWSYGRRSTRAINELRRLLATVRDELPQVRAPVLAVHGARDRMIDPACAHELRHRLVCSAAVETHLLPRSGHAVSVDVDRTWVEESVVAWLEEHATIPRLSAAG